MTTDTIEPRLAMVQLALEKRFLEAARLLVKSLAPSDGLPNDPDATETLSDLVIQATKDGEFGQVVRMIDEPSIRRYLRPDIVVWRSAYARIAEARARTSAT